MKALLFFVALAVFVSGCTQLPEGPALNQTQEGGAEIPPDFLDQALQELEETVEVPPQPVKEFNISARQWEFLPSSLEVEKGDRVILKVTSFDVAHGFWLPEFGIQESLEPGRVVTVEFVADREGTFPFICSVFCGTGHAGMRGQLVVKG